MESLDGAVNDARPGIQAFSKQTLPEVGQLVRDLRVMSESLSAIAAKIDQGGAGSIVGGGKLPIIMAVEAIMKISRLALCGVAAISLSGCISFGAKPPKTLLTLVPSVTVAANTARQGVRARP